MNIIKPVSIDPISQPIVICNKTVNVLFNIKEAIEEPNKMVVKTNSKSIRIISDDKATRK